MSRASGLPTLRDVMPAAGGSAAIDSSDTAPAVGRRRRPTAWGALSNAAKRAAAWARMGRSPAQPRSRAAAAPAEKPHRKSPRRANGLFAAPLRFIALIAFLDVSLKREGKNLHILIAAKPPAVKKQERVQKAIAEAEPLRRALKAFLDLHPLTRRMLRHLGYLEHALATQGYKAFAEVPVEVLEVSLEQLESIVSNWSDRDLADLRSRLAVAVRDRLQDRFGGDRQLSDFATASRMMIHDVPHSEFEELERQYQGLVPPETLQAALDAVRTPAGGEAEAVEAPYAIPLAAGESHPIQRSQQADHEAVTAPAALGAPHRAP